ncbi:MAG: hemerythrin domain-containing protein [Planctomycetota bacterium]|nr:hemerythrin domain-containing protein [Planctomycetota bacterium]
MSLTTILSREHQVILSRLGELEDALKDLDLAMLEDVLRFFEADLPLHRRKEEEILFPVLARHIGAEGGPISAMLAEHETEKAYLEDLRRAVNEVKSGADAGGAVRSSATAILFLLRAHIQKEDEFLFPMAEQFLTDEEKAEVGRAMEAIGTCCSQCRVT